MLPLSYDVPPSQSCAAPPLGAASGQVLHLSKSRTSFFSCVDAPSRPLPGTALAFEEPVAGTPIRSARCRPRPGRMAPSMGVDAYQTNQISRTTFRAYQSATPVKMPPSQPAAAPSAKCRPSAIKCRPLNHVPPLHWVLPLVKCRPLSKSGFRVLSRVDAPGRPSARWRPRLCGASC